MDQFFENGQIVLFQGDSVTDCGPSETNLFVKTPVATSGPVNSVVAPAVTFW